MGSWKISDEEFEKFRKLIYDECRINLTPAKKPLLMNRLSKRLRVLGLNSFGEYFEYINSDKGRQEEFLIMVDSITTNKTEFFREPKQWLYMRDVLWPQLFERKQSGGKLRIWSAGCSSGEEPYSILLSYLKYAPGAAPWRFELLATDLSNRMLDFARAGVYDEDRVACIPKETLTKFFSRTPQGYRVQDRLRAMIRFERVNLAEPFNWLREPFDVIFCRNVIIYFDKPTQEGLMRKYHQALQPEGHLFLGHAETLNGLDTGFTFVAPTIYRK